MDFLLSPEDFKSTPVLTGELEVPGDKSISHRALIFGALAEGVTTITHFLASQDTLATRRILESCAVKITDGGPGELQVEGVGLAGLQAPKGDLYCGNSGTSMRLLAGLFAGQNFSVRLTGDESLSRRPMERVTDPLQHMGATISAESGGCAPLHIHPAKHGLKGVEYTLPVASAQVKSALLLASLYADGPTTVIQPQLCRDHTERMLAQFGWPIRHNEASVRMEAGGTLTAQTITVPGDISSAAFFLVAATLLPGSMLTLKNVGMNAGRKGVVEVLKAMGASIQIQNEKLLGQEPVADLVVSYAPLRAANITGDIVPTLIDELPILLIAAACAEGTTVLRDAKELRQKESDRLAAMADGLTALGVEVTLQPDGMTVVGQGGKPFTGGTLHSRGDHRIAMAFAVAGCLATAPVHILNCDNIATSYPNFVEQANQVGLPIQTRTSHD